MIERDFKSIINRIVNYGQEKLNDWEIEFISSVYQRHFLDDKKLSQKQEEIILKINRKLLSGK